MVSRIDVQNPGGAMGSSRAPWFSAVQEAGSARWCLLSQQSGQQGAQCFYQGGFARDTLSGSQLGPGRILPDGGDQQPSFILTQPVQHHHLPEQPALQCPLAQFEWFVMVGKAIEFPMLEFIQIRHMSDRSASEG